MLAVPVIVLPDAAVIVPVTVPTVNVAPDATGPATLQVSTPPPMEHPDGNAPD
jgi:hypothetical protein